MKTTRHLFLIGIFSLSLIASPKIVDGDALIDCQDMLEDTGSPTSQTNEENWTFLCRTGYVLAHNSKHRVPDWVIEKLTSKRLKGKANRKKSSFKPDRELDSKIRAELSDYSGSGYDRGHMAPAADMKWDQKAMDESFYLSNMAPQVGAGFNRGIWRELERYARDLVNEREPIIVITGPIYEGRVRKSQQGSNVDVPSHFYKIIYNPKSKRAIAFKLPNKKISTRRKAPHSLVQFIETVHELENLTGLDFFSRLSRREQRRIEITKANLWRVYDR